MKLDISKVEFSKNDIKNNIKIPNHLTSELAYLIGIHLGDGTMNFYKKKNDYYISYAGHIIDEKEFHKTIIKKLFKSIFNKETKINLDLRKKHSCLRTYIRSKAILTFLNRVAGLPLGSKENCDIPKIIKNSNLEIKRAFLKGLADTEFCLSFAKGSRKKHNYPMIKYATPNKKLQKSIVNILKIFGFSIHSVYDYVSYRKGKKQISNKIDIINLSNLNLWFKEIGFNSTKHLTKYKVWKKFGFCPPNTNIIERRKILKGEIDINSYYKGP